MRKRQKKSLTTKIARIADKIKQTGRSIKEHFSLFQGEYDRTN